MDKLETTSIPEMIAAAKFELSLIYSLPETPVRGPEAVQSVARSGQNSLAQAHMRFALKRTGFVRVNACPRARGRTIRGPKWPK
jgi:hypothetical protein